MSMMVWWMWLINASMEMERTFNGCISLHFRTPRHKLDYIGKQTLQDLIYCVQHMDYVVLITNPRSCIIYDVWLTDGLYRTSKIPVRWPGQCYGFTLSLIFKYCGGIGLY